MYSRTFFMFPFVFPHFRSWPLGGHLTLSPKAFQEPQIGCKGWGPADAAKGGKSEGHCAPRCGNTKREHKNPAGIQKPAGVPDAGWLAWPARLLDFFKGVHPPWSDWSPQSPAP